MVILAGAVSEMSLYAVNGKTPIAAWIPSRTQSADDFFGVNNGTLVNGASIVADTGAGGTDAFSLDGVNDYVEAGVQTGLSGLASASFWIKRSGGNGFHGIVGCSNAAGDNVSFHCELSNSQFIGAVWGVNPYLRVATASAAGLNTWTHGCVVRSGSVGNWLLNIYVNGVLALSLLTAIATGTDQPLSIGRPGAFNGQYFPGRIDDVRLWSLALNATDVAALYAAQRGGITNPPTIFPRRRRSRSGGGVL
jgi:hypothetical protein